MILCSVPLVTFWCSTPPGISVGLVLCPAFEAIEENRLHDRRGETDADVPGEVGLIKGLPYINVIINNDMGTLIVLMSSHNHCQQETDRYPSICNTPF